MLSYKFYGDCLGLSPDIYGHNSHGDYIQSDIQFAQMVKEDFRLVNDESDFIPEDFYMVL